MFNFVLCKNVSIGCYQFCTVNMYHDTSYTDNRAMTKELAY